MSGSSKPRKLVDKKEGGEDLKKLNQELLKENSSLSKELLEIKSLHQQILHEGSSENFSERRVNVLKSQIFQLERQVVLLSETVNSYAATQAELYTVLETLAKKLSSGSFSSEELTRMARQMQARLSKSSRSAESTGVPLLSAKDFVSSATRREAGGSEWGEEDKGAVTILDICMGEGVDHINLKHVQQFKSSPELSSTEILKRMPPAIRTKKEVREAMERACSHLVHASDLNSRKCQALEEELEFHKSVYQLQVSYVESLFDAVREGYQAFESSAQNLICMPMKDVLSTYEELRATASDVALRKFLKQVQENVMQLKSAVETLSSPHQEDHTKGTKCTSETAVVAAGGGEVLSEFGTNFFKALQRLEGECSKRRAESLSTLKRTPKTVAQSSMGT